MTDLLNPELRLEKLNEAAEHINKAKDLLQPYAGLPQIFFVVGLLIYVKSQIAEVYQETVRKAREGRS